MGKRPPFSFFRILSFFLFISFLVYLVGPRVYAFLGKVGMYTKKGVTFYVTPNEDHPIQKALEKAYPGDTIVLSPGKYFEDIKTVRDGLLYKPITIRGNNHAVLYGNGAPRIAEINHSYIHFIGFTIDGMKDQEDKMSSYRDKLIYIQGKREEGTKGVKIQNMILTNAGGECVRLRYFVHDTELSYNTITNCGIFDFRFDDGGKNGEGIYIGTAPEQTDDGKNPTSLPDNSNSNWIHHNTINTNGNECVDIKEGAKENIVEYNMCTGQKDPNSAGLDSRGNNNIFRFNEVFGNSGAGVRLGGDSESDGISNDVYKNILRNNKKGGINIQRTPQGKICENILTEIEEDFYTIGKYKTSIHPLEKCT